MPPKAQAIYTGALGKVSLMSRSAVDDAASPLSLEPNQRGPARPDLEYLAGVSLAAAIVVAILGVAEPFEHGVWLVAYLFLVGFLAQFTLGRGQAALVSRAGLSGPPLATRRRELGLWNFGVVIVPFGVLLDARLAVFLGTMALLLALCSLWAGARPALAATGQRHRALGLSYRGLLLFMAGSALTGLALAWDIPWI